MEDGLLESNHHKIFRILCTEKIPVLKANEPIDLGLKIQRRNFLEFSAFEHNFVLCHFLVQNVYYN